MLEMDHCLSNPCDANAICTNTDDHSFSCKCKAGFSGNGIQCKGIFFHCTKGVKEVTLAMFYTLCCNNLWQLTFLF